MLRVCLPVLFLFLAGCGSVQGPHAVRLALDGPPLPIAADKNGTPLRGVMDRGCMAGTGRMTLADKERGVTCTGAMDAPADEKARLHIDLLCDNGETVSVIMRNLGPDQGVGVGRINETNERLFLFYHPSKEEAERRLARIKDDIEQALARKAAQQE